jgi:hypothetical protein
MAIDCSPSARLEQYKCLACGTQSQLLVALLVALISDPESGYTLPGDTNQLMADSACWNCLTDTQLLQAIVSSFGELYEDTFEAGEFRDMVKCLQCASPRQIKSAIAMLICQRNSREDDER